jgi:hypothetical protein
MLIFTRRATGLNGGSKNYEDHLVCHPIYDPADGPTLERRVCGTNAKLSLREIQSCDTKPKATPSPAKQQQPPKRSPLPPVKFQVRDVILRVNPSIDDKELPGLDAGSGTAESTEYNYNIGKANNSGHFAERRRYVYDTYKLAEAAHKNGEVSRENFEKVTNLLKDKLERINEQEREAYSAESNEVLQELRKDIETRVDAENQKRADQTVKEIEKMDLEQFDTKYQTIEQVLQENLAQSRALELMGADGKRAFNRVMEIIDALAKKMRRIAARAGSRCRPCLELTGCRSYSAARR